MSDTKKLAAVALVGRVCNHAVKTYMKEPWRWSRESDLVADLVGSFAFDLREDAWATGNINAPGLCVREVERRVPRVRTEIRPNGDRAKLDIGILGSTPVNVFLRPAGARDVVLEVSAAELSAVVEVKLEPGLVQSGWLSDIVKLRNYRQAGIRVVLWLDTSLPLESVGVHYQRSRRAVARSQEEFPTPWPLRHERLDIPLLGQESPSATVRLLPVEGPEDNGLYLVALALKSGFAPEDFNAPLPDHAVHPAWWKVLES